MTAWSYRCFLPAKPTFKQRWSPRGRPWPRGRPQGQILESLALASKPQVLENCPVLGSRTAPLLFESLKFYWKAPETSQKICEDLFLFSSSGNRLKKIFWRPFSPEKNFEDLFLRLLEVIYWKPSFFWRTLAFVSLVLSLGLERVCPWLRNFFVSLSLASSLMSSTPPLLLSVWWNNLDLTRTTR